MSETIERIKKLGEELEENASNERRQDFIAFRNEEFEALKKAEEKLRELNIYGKSKTIALVCKYMLQDLKQSKKDGK